MWLWLAAGCMVLTAVAHSTLSETRLMKPLVAPGLHRTIVRYALHAMSVYMLLSALTVAWPGTPAGLILVEGAGWIIVGIAGLLVSRGKHLGWPLITAAGVFTLIGAMA